MDIFDPAAMEVAWHNAQAAAKMQLRPSPVAARSAAEAAYWQQAQQFPNWVERTLLHPHEQRLEPPPFYPDHPALARQPTPPVRHAPPVRRMGRRNTQISLAWDTTTPDRKRRPVHSPQARLHTSSSTVRTPPRARAPFRGELTELRS